MYSNAERERWGRRLTSTAATVHPMISTIDRLLFREVFKALGLIIAVLVIILLANSLVHLLGKVAAGSVSQDVLFALVGLELLKIVGFMIPPAFFFSILWVLGRMYRDSEMIAVEAAGVSTFRVFRSFFIAAVPLAVGVLWLVMYVLPWAKSYTLLLKAEQKASGEITGLRAGRFNEFSRGDVVVFAEAASLEEGLKGLFVQHRQHGKIGIVTAERAHIVRDEEADARYVVLVDGRRYEGRPGFGDYSIGEFAEYGLKIPKADLSQQGVPESAKSWRTLWASDEPAERAEFQYRLSFPLAVLTFVLVSVPLARSLPREGVYGRLGLAVVVYFVFMNLLRLGQHWMETETTPPWLGVWWVPFLMALVAGLLLFFDSMWFAGRWRRWRNGRHEPL